MSLAGRCLLARICAAAFFAFLFAGSLRAGTAAGITGLYTTGADANGDGLDDHWLRGGGTAAYVVSNTNAANHGWVTTSSAKWISPTANGGVLFGAGSYSYTLTFDITGAPGSSPGDEASNVSIYLTLATEGSAAITVNGGNSVSTTGSTPWTQTQAITLSSGFVIGSNTITITVQNPYWLYGYQGVLVSSITGVVPEAGAWVPLAGALLLFAWFRLRPKKKLPLAV